MTPRSACVSLRCFRRVLAWTRRAVWLMALPMTPWASRITGPACRATRSCMRRALLADWLCCLSAAARWPRAWAATAVAGVSGGITIRVPSPRSSLWRSRHGSPAASNARCSMSYMMRRRVRRSSSLRSCALNPVISVSMIGQSWPVNLAVGLPAGAAARRQDRNGSARTDRRGTASPRSCRVPTDLDEYFCVFMAPPSRVVRI